MSLLLHACITRKPARPTSLLSRLPKGSSRPLDPRCQPRHSSRSSLASLFPRSRPCFSFDCPSSRLGLNSASCSVANSSFFSFLCPDCPYSSFHRFSPPSPTPFPSFPTPASRAPRLFLPLSRPSVSEGVVGAGMRTPPRTTTKRARLHRLGKLSRDVASWHYTHIPHRVSAKEKSAKEVRNSHSE